MNQLSDEELIARCVSGDRCSMDVLVSRYHGKLLELALRHLGNREVSADVAQATLVKVFQAATTFNYRSSFRTWLYAITLNMIRDAARKRKRRCETLFSEISEDEDSPLDLASEDESAEDSALRQIESILLWQAVNNLPEMQRSAIILRFRMDLKYDEIAEVMRVPSGTVKSWIHYALKALKKFNECEE